MSVIGFESVSGIHEKALMVRGQRNHLLANNISNANTPGYKAKDIDFRQAMKSLVREKHTPESALTSTENHVKYRVPLQPTLDNNTVEGHVEMAEYSRNSMEFLATLRFLNGSLTTMERAFRGE